MAGQDREKLNRIQHLLPAGAVVEGAWLEARDYPRSLRKYYLDHGWLESPARNAFSRPGSHLTWQSVIHSLQSLMCRDVLVGGQTALEIHGYVHYLRLDKKQTIHLYTEDRLPAWLNQLGLEGVRFAMHRPTRLFGADDLKRVLRNYRGTFDSHGASHDIEVHDWGPTKQAVLISTVERGILELIEQLPHQESFHQVDVVFESLSTIRPSPMQALLERCKSVKTKRLFFWFSRRHRHGWLKHLDEAAIDLGRGKRALVPGGKLDARYQITVPESLFGKMPNGD